MCDAMAHELAEARREVELMRITETNWQPIGEQGSDGTYRKFTVVNGSTGYLPAGKYRVIDGELVRVLECPVDDEITALRKDRDRLREQLAVEKIVSRDLRGEVERMRLKWQTGPVPCPGGYLVRVKGMVDAKYLFAGALIECEWAGPIPEPSEGE
jgi:HAMP domain-containing protein